MSESSTLKRQAQRWKRQAEKEEMPDGLLMALADGAEGIAKRQIVSLAKVSRIVADDGTIRPYNDFKNDWKYTKSVFGHRDTCGLCGKHPIVENCVLHDSVADKEILVGNTCVFRYVEIEVNGVKLTDEEKKEYLKENMKEAKKQFNRETFAQQYPDALGMLKRYEPMMTEKIGRRKVQPKWFSIYRSMTKRMMTHGFPSPKLWRQWDDFMSDSEEQLQAWNKKKEEQRLARQRRMEEAQERAKRFNAELAEKRNQYAKEAEEWKTQIEDLESEFNDWEKKFSNQVRLTIQQYGKDRLHGGTLRFFNEVQVRYSIKNGIHIEGNELTKELESFLNAPRFLNAWEQSFVKSLLIREHLNRTMTEKQVVILNKIRTRWKAKA